MDKQAEGLVGFVFVLLFGIGIVVFVIVGMEFDDTDKESKGKVKLMRFVWLDASTEWICWEPVDGKLLMIVLEISLAEISDDDCDDCEEGEDEDSLE